MIPISSRSNPRFKSLRLLTSSAKERKSQGCTVLEGTRLVASYLDRCGVPRLIVISDAASLRPEIARLLARAAGCEVLCFREALFAQLAPVEHSTGIIAVIEIPPAVPLVDFGQCVVMLDGIQDPGNAGAIIRSAAAAGADQILMSAGCTDPWSPKALRAAMGGHFSVVINTGVELLSAVRRFPGLTIAATARNGVPPQAMDLRGRVAILFGSEAEGLRPELEDAAQARVSIPTAHGIESLNVGAAAAVILFERVRQLDGFGASDIK